MKPFFVEKNARLFSSGHQQALRDWALRKPHNRPCNKT